MRMEVMVLPLKDSEQPRDGVEQPFEEWLSDRIEEWRSEYRDGPRSQNKRQSDIALGRIRALRDARTEYLDRKHNRDGSL